MKTGHLYNKNGIKAKIIHKDYDTYLVIKHNLARRQSVRRKSKKRVTQKDIIEKEMRLKHGKWDKFTFISKMLCSRNPLTHIASFIQQEFYDKKTRKDYDTAYKYVKAVRDIQNDRDRRKTRYKAAPMLNRKGKELSEEYTHQLEYKVNDKIEGLAYENRYKRFHFDVSRNYKQKEILKDINRGWSKGGILSVHAAINFIRHGYIYADNKNKISLRMYPGIVNSRNELFFALTYKDKEYLVEFKDNVNKKNIESEILRINMGLGRFLNDTQGRSDT